MRRIIAVFVLFVSSSMLIALHGQGVQITGTITHAAEGTPLPGVNVVIKGTQTGVITDMDGNYTIDAPTGAVLQYSSLGMLSQEITVNAETHLNVALEEDITGLDEVIVVGYGTALRSSFVGATTVVKAREIATKPVSSVEKGLQGLAPGLLTSTQSGTPGSGTDVIIRGIGSINASTDPLYIVDGVPIASGDVFAYRFYTTNPLASLDPSDIESVTILKDASATSIYGARASNGVIVITTKKGSAGKTVFQFTTQLGQSSRLTDNFDVLNAPEYKELMYEQLVNAGIAPYEAYARTLDMGDRETDWMDEIFRKGLDQKYGISARGGSDKTTFYISGNYRKQEGVVIGSDMERYTALVNLEYQASKMVRLGVNTSASYTKVNGSSGEGYYSDPITAAFFIPPTRPVRNEDGSYNHDIPENLDYNAVSSTILDIDAYDQKKYFGNFFAELTPLENLTFRTVAGVDFFNMGEYLYWNPNSSSGEGYQGYSEYAGFERLNWILTNTANYQKSIGVHDMDVLVGQEVQSTHEFGTRIANSKFPSDRFVTLVNGAEPLTANTFKEGASLASFFSSFNYTYAKRYSLGLSARRDGSSRFGANNRWANFGSVGLSWRITEEAFMDAITALDDLKLRFSYGSSGNQAILGYDSDGDPYNDYYASLGLYQYGARYNGEPGSELLQLENPDLQWEKNLTTNLGVDFVTLGGRLNGSFELYHKNTKDLLLLVPVSATTGVDVLLMNVGAMENKGVEVEMQGVLIDQSFKWTMGANFTANKNKVTALDNDEPIYDGATRQQATVGHAYRTFYLERWAGVNPADGSAMWLDGDGNPVMDYNNAEKVLLDHTADPDFYGSFSNTFSYKDVALSMQFYGMYGNSIYNNSDRFLSSDGSGTTNVDRRQLGRWLEEGDITSVPLRIDGASSGNKNSTRHLEDGSYLKLKNVTLSYDLPKQWVAKFRCQGLRVYLLAENAYTWTHFTGWDPEGSLTGISWFKYPNAKTFAMGLNLTF